MNESLNLWSDNCDDTLYFDDLYAYDLLAVQMTVDKI